MAENNKKSSVEGAGEKVHVVEIFSKRTKKNPPDTDELIRDLTKKQKQENNGGE